MYSLTAGLTALVVASALPASAYQPWVAPGANDVRSPCPGLNSLANHNYIPHSGRGLTLPIMLAGLAEGMNIGADFTTSITALGMLSNPNQPALSFDLDMLDEHNFPIEHDASLSREDAYFGDDHSFNQTIWDMVLAYFPPGASDILTSKQAALARNNRVKVEQGRDPTFTYLPNTAVLSLGETALYLSSMGDPVTGDARADFVRSLFEEEKLPFELGWDPTARAPVTLPGLTLLINKMVVETNDELPEGIDILATLFRIAL